MSRLVNKIYKLATKFAKASSSDFVTLYHISNHGPGAPKPYKHNMEGWLRGKQRKEPIPSGIFFSPSPALVWHSHGIRGKIHVYNVRKNNCKRRYRL